MLCVIDRFKRKEIKSMGGSQSTKLITGFVRLDKWMMWGFEETDPSIQNGWRQSRSTKHGCSIFPGQILSSLKYLGLWTSLTSGFVPLAFGSSDVSDDYANDGSANDDYAAHSMMRRGVQCGWEMGRHPHQKTGYFLKCQTPPRPPFWEPFVQKTEI